MGQFDSLYKCTLGGADFQLSKLKESNQSVRDGGRETARSITMAGEGWLEGSSGADLAAKIAALRTAMNTRGQDFIVTGLGGVTYCQVLAAQCLNGGPHVDFEIEDSDTPLVQTIRFSVAATASAGVSQNPNSFPAKEDTRKLSVEAGADELRTITIEASVSGPGSERFFLDVVARNLQEQYPWSNWVLKYKYEINLNDDKLDYTVTAKELAESFPNAGNRARVMDGELIEQSERDGERLLWTTSCDFVIQGNPQDVVDAVRPANATLVKESVEFSFHQESRVRASFTELLSVDGTGLLEWEASLEVEREDALVRAVGYDGQKVDLVYDSVPWRLVFSGRAVGIGKYPKEVLINPPKDYVADAYAKPKLRRVNAYERETTWSQSFLGTRGLGDYEVNALKDSLSRPPKPAFYP